MKNQPLPNIPVPAPPKDPPCEWCGKRPAEQYEVAPPVTAMKKQANGSGQEVTVKTLRKAATMAYACREHRELFDQRKIEAGKRADEESRLRKEAKRRGER